jgi:hypothetical protein
MPVEPTQYGPNLGATRRGKFASDGRSSRTYRLRIVSSLDRALQLLRLRMGCRIT